ncbi:HPr kinase/phosphorylase [Roseovarius sp. SYSU LYC5161]|uniref:HPr kinase/phosphorylase n=1 Tax=Roseovarius halophilus (ex Wu et al. 2025) TaxID=3376060 RepID=UPI00287241C5|nr:HPr kinase/phosphatase C-terminal domain-containing protein [Roseovarius sp.]
MACPGPAQPQPEDLTTVHASCVAVAGRGVLIRGASGSGKSALALQLMALGAALVADDRTRLWRDGSRVLAGCPPRIAGLIEARGVGLLSADASGPVPVALIVDLDRTETERLPPQRQAPLLQTPVAVLHGQPGRHFPAAIMLYITAGRVA